MLTGIPALAPDGTRAFDCDEPLSADTAAAFHRAGYRAALRYVPRVSRHENDISGGEAQTILAAGLALGIVQHVAPDPWTPTLELGRDYGTVAAEQCEAIGLPQGVNVWCDLEGVRMGTTPQMVADYLHEWWTAVATKGYLPGLYVGWRAGLSARDLYALTKFQYFWSSYNLNADQFPVTRGVCMRQELEQKLAGIKFDPETCRVDALNNRAAFLAPSTGWPDT